MLIEQAKKQKKWTEFEVEELFRMKDEGLTYKEIAKELGVTVDSVANKLRHSTRHVIFIPILMNTHFH